MKALVVGLPKSGTMTLHKAMESAGLRSCHWKSKNGLCGKLMYRGLIEKNDPFYYLQDYDVVTQSDVCLPHQSKNYWPQLDYIMLAKIRQKYPDLLFILNKREPEKTYRSMSNWANVRGRIKRSDVPGLPKGYGETQEEFVQWIENCYEAFEYFFSGDNRVVSGYIDDPSFRQGIEDMLEIKFNWWSVAEETATSLVNERSE